MRARRFVSLVWLLLATGCVSPPERPLFVPPGEPVAQEQNPVFIPLGRNDYGKLFEHVLSVLIDNGFEIKESNRYDGRIETEPRTAPGLGQFLKPGSPDLYERTLATAQSYRHRVSVVIQPELHGYFVEVIVRKELEDLPRPTRATAGNAIFRNDNSVERQFEVIDPTIFETGWIYKGRDVAFEERIISQLASPDGSLVCE